MRWAALLLAGLLALWWAPVVEAALPTTYTFIPSADTYVDSATPNTSYGSSTAMWIDGQPRKEVYIRFDVSGLTGFTIDSAVLRIHQRDASPTGGRLGSMSNTSWAEATTTWNTRPAIDGPILGELGPVSSGVWYELDVTAAVRSDGTVSFGISSADADGARWQSRESSTPPQLVVTMHAEGPPQEADGLSTVAPGPEGSSSPTYHSSQRHLAMTSGGRLLVVHGKHATGLQLAWRDPAGTWQRITRGATTTGALLTGTQTGDWPASIVVRRTASGAEHAWIVWAGPHHAGPTAPKLIRLSALDDPAGPHVGPTVTLDPTPGYKIDLAFEVGPDGATRAAVLWGRRVGDATYELVSGWLTDLETDTPTLTSLTTHITHTAANRYGTLVQTQQGLRAVVRGPSGRLRVLRHLASDPLTTWTMAPTAGVNTDHVSAVALSDGSLVAATESDVTNHIVSVQRFSNDGAPAPTDLQVTGYQYPSLATDGVRAWVVMTRTADGFVVSREYAPSTGWSSTDRIEIGPEGGGGHTWPNLLRDVVDGRLRFVVRGPYGTSTTRSSVLAFQRTV